MNILWISHFIPYPPKGGMLLRSYNLLKQLSRRNNIDLIALARRDTLEGMYPSFDDALQDCQQVLSSHCVNAWLVETRIGLVRGASQTVALRSLLPGPPYSVRWLYSKAMQAKIDSILLSHTYDLVHVDTIGLAEYLPAEIETPTALNHHNIESDMMSVRASKEKHPVKRAYYLQEAWRLRNYEREHCCRFALNITCSKDDCKRLLDIDNRLRVREIPNGVDLEYFRPSPNAEQLRRLVFVGGQSWYPNRDAMEFFAEAIWPKLVQKFSSVSFDLIGRDPSPIVKAAAEKYAGFRVHGFVDDIRDTVSTASVYVCPIRDGGGTKLKMLDALAMGKAIVAHPMAVDGLGLVPEEHFLLAESPDEFVKQIGRLFVDNELRLKLQTRARCVAEERFSFESIGERLHNYYVETVQSAPRLVD